jgi:hypothetical protein
MRTELLRFPPRCTPAAARKIQYDGRRIDLESDVWAVISSYRGPLLFEAMPDCWLDPRDLTPIVGSRSQDVTDPKWSCILQDNLDLPTEDPDPLEKPQDTDQDVPITVVDTQSASVATLNLLLHMLKKAAVQFRQSPTVYTALHYVAAKARARRCIKREEWAAMKIPYEYTLRRELGTLENTLRNSVKALKQPPSDATTIDLAKHLGERPLMGLTGFKPRAHIESSPESDKYKWLGGQKLTWAYLSMGARVDRLKTHHPEFYDGPHAGPFGSAVAAHAGPLDSAVAAHAGPSASAVASKEQNTDDGDNDDVSSMSKEEPSGKKGDPMTDGEETDDDDRSD